MHAGPPAARAGAGPWKMVESTMPKRGLLDSGIWHRLSSLRSSLRRRLAGEASAWLIVALVALVFVTLAFDYYLRLDRPLRVLIMGLCLVGVLWVLWRHLVRPMLVPMRVEDLALLVERRHAELGDRLIAAVEFSQADLAREHPFTRVLIGRLGDQANEAAGRVDFHSLVERRNLWRAVGIAACAAMLLGGFSVWQHDVMSLWFQRNVTIWSNAEWPQQTELRVEGGPDFTVVRGRNLGVTVSVKPGMVVPKYVTFHAKFPSDPDWTEDRVELSDAEKRTFVKVFRAVAEPFEFYVTGGDDAKDKRRPHTVHVLDPPKLDRVKFLVRHPAYRGDDSDHVYDGAPGAINVPAGSVVKIDARTTKDLVEAHMYLNKKPVGKMAFYVDPETGRTDPRRVLGRLEMGVPSPGAGAVLERKLSLALLDTDKIYNDDTGLYLIQVLPDQAPKITVRKRGVSSTVTPQATIPLMLDASDDCGVAGLTARIQVLPKKGKPILEDVKLVGPVAKDVLLRHDLDLRERFEPKTVIQITVEARDNLPKDMKGPNRSLGGLPAFRIVRPDELMEELVRRQKELRLEFVQTIAVQTTARAKSMTARQQAQAELAKPDAQRDLRLAGASLVAAASMQTSIASECAKAALTLQGIYDELTYNKLGSPEGKRQLKDNVITPLEDLAQPIRDLVASLRKAAELTDARAMVEQADLAAATQQKILDRLKEIRNQMHKIETRQELAYKLEKLIGLWGKVVEGTGKASESEAGGVIGPSTKPKKKDE